MILKVTKDKIKDKDWIPTLLSKTKEPSEKNK